MSHIAVRWTLDNSPAVPGADFVVLHTTTGATARNYDAPRQSKELKRLGIPVAYGHLFAHDDDPLDQMVAYKNFTSLLGKVALPPVLLVPDALWDSDDYFVHKLRLLTENENTIPGHVLLLRDASRFEISDETFDHWALGDAR